MDGIVIDFEEFKKGQRSFKIAGVQAAGGKQLTLQDSKECIEVMTGAVLPNKANTVIRYEYITVKNGVATVALDEIKKRQNIHDLHALKS